MGPTNVALVKLFRADQALRQAQERLDAASKNVRVQERRVHDLSEKLKLAQTTLRETQSKAKQLELELATRNAHIEKLREKQTTTHNNKEYQAYTVEISTQKVDRTKAEEESLKALEAAEKAQADVNAASALLEAEKAKLAGMKQQSGEQLAGHVAEVESLRPARDAAAAAVPPRAREAFERLAEHHDGEAMSALSKPDPRREEYLCTACNMELARDVYNKLHSRDDMVVCPSCRRILYIPEDLTPETALGASKPAKSAGPKKVRVAKPKAPKAPKAPKGEKQPAAGAGAAAAPATGATSDDAASDGDEVVIEQRAKGKLGEALTKAQGETVRSANAAGEKPVECEVYVNGELAGIYKGQTPQKLQNAARYFLEEAGITGAVEVKPVAKEEPAPAAEATAEVPAEAPAASAGTGEAASASETSTPHAEPQAAEPAAPSSTEASPAPQAAGSAESETSHASESAEPASAGSGPQG